MKKYVLLTPHTTAVDRVINLIDSLPPMPEHVSRLRKISSNPYSRFQDFQPLIEADPVLCADILHMANSAYYGLNRTIESVGEAIRYIGIKHLADYVSTFFSNRVLKKLFAKITDLSEYFKHSQAISLATKIVAKHAKKPIEYQDFCTVAGLLHDIGRLILLLISDKDRTKLLGHKWEDVTELVEKEKELTGVDHCYVGMKLCEKWRFSQKLQTSILYHHAPFGEHLYEESAFILLAHFISMTDFPEQQLAAVYEPATLARMNLTTEALFKSRQEYHSLSSSV